MKKLKRNDLKKIDGGLITPIIMCDENMNCPVNLCFVHQDTFAGTGEKYPCI